MKTECENVRASESSSCVSARNPSTEWGPLFEAGRVSAQQLLLVYMPSYVSQTCTTCLIHVRPVEEAKTWPDPGDFSYAGGVHALS